ncbi:MAG: YaaA family protein [Desulfobulbus sp.]
MIIFTSSKGQDFSPATPPLPHTEPEFQHKARELNAILNTLDLAGLQQLMGISAPLAARTREQILGFAAAEPKPALLTYSGEAFRSLNAAAFSIEDFRFAQAHFRIFSGLYGPLRPLDLIAPHRLEMGYKLTNPAGESLYPFWSKDITAHLNAALKQESAPLLINLASMEYSKVVEKKKLCGPWIDIQFKEQAGDTLKSVAIYAKRARGMMASYLIKNRIETLNDVIPFSDGGYTYHPELSKERLLVFTRPQP